MPRSRKRPGHPYQKPADIPASQRTKGRVGLSVLFAVFGLLIAYFAFGANWGLLLLLTAVGAVFGWLAGKRMEREATHKS